jgi:hypothetical protein
MRLNCIIDKNLKEKIEPPKCSGFCKYTCLFLRVISLMSGGSLMYMGTRESLHIFCDDD